jgi:hypothetical protein
MAFSPRENAAGWQMRNRFSPNKSTLWRAESAVGVGVGGSQESGRNPVLCREDIDSNSFTGLHELRRVADEAILRDLDALVVSVQKVEGLGHQFQFDPVADINSASESQISGGIVGSKERIAGNSGEPVVVVIAILVGIAGHGGTDRPPAAIGKYACRFPIVKESSQPLMIAIKRFGGKNERENEALPLISDARTFLRIGRVRVLHRRWTSRHERILAVVDGVRESVGKHEVNPAGHAAANGESGAMIDTRGRALENVDRSKLRNGTRQRD